MTEELQGLEPCPVLCMGAGRTLAPGLFHKARVWFCQIQARS